MAATSTRTSPRTRAGSHARVQSNYQQAVAAGGYNVYRANLSGKHDNVRVFWEDQIRRLFIRPHLQTRCEQKIRPVRVLDLGCGSGQGFDLLTQIEGRPRGLALYHDWVLRDTEIEYVGVDLSEAMVEKGRENYAGRANVCFFQGDLNEGLGPLHRETPFDIYFSSYGSFSHLTRRKMESLLVEIARHANRGALIVLDFNGRYSCEWPGLWPARVEAEKTRDYTMNYLYLGDRVAMARADHFPLRFWAGDEVVRLARSAAKRAGRSLELLDQRDCSLLVGRHVDTAQYNPALKPLRRIVNSLHQDFMRTDLSKLVVDPRLAGEHPVVTPVLSKLIRSWNALVDFTRRRLEKPVRIDDIDDWSDFPPELQFAILGMDRVIADAAWIQNGDARANLVEPQLAYLLRSLEISLQRGIGSGHGLLAILQMQ